MIHLCSTEVGSSGSPILNLSNKKIIGIHKESLKRYEFNRGTFLREPFIDFIDKYKNNDEKKCTIEYNKEFKNEIKIHLKIENSDIKKEIYFIGNNKSHIFEYGKVMENDLPDILQELNESNTLLYINGKKNNYKQYFIPLKEGIYSIILKTKRDIIDCSYMFYKCDNITSIDLSSFGSERVKKMHYMFYECINLKNIDFSSFKTENVTNMEFMFYGCKSLKNIDLSSFNIKNIKKITLMFDGCQSLRKIKIPEKLFMKMTEKDRFSIQNATRQLIN